MTNGRAFEFDDLIVLLGLDPSESADQADIEAIADIVSRRRATNSTAGRAFYSRPTLRLVPDPTP